MRISIEMRQLPRFRVMNDLEQVGGQITEAWCVAGKGWTASLEALEPETNGHAGLPRDLLVIEGDDPAVERVAAFMRHRVAEMQRGR
ncbi:MAG: hypothetical protein K8S97_02760 [Anaerolineae bacterium]|nr:hypothetical protein [Anaerolineae bacterium]